MTKKYLIGLIILLVLIAIIYLTPLVYKFGLIGPKNYAECIKAGGQTNKNQPRVIDTCYFKGKRFEGSIF